MSNQEVKVSKSRFAIVRFLATLSNAGDEGKHESFLVRLIKRLKKENKTFSRNISTLKYEFDNALETLEDNLSDAKSDLENAYSDIDVNQLSNNKAQDVYAEVYLAATDKATLAVKAIESKIKKLKEDHDKEVEEIQDQIDSNDIRIAAIGREK